MLHTPAGVVRHTVASTDLAQNTRWRLLSREYGIIQAHEERISRCDTLGCYTSCRGPKDRLGAALASAFSLPASTAFSNAATVLRATIFGVVAPSGGTNAQRRSTAVLVANGSE
jgi:hypothetical protein